MSTSGIEFLPRGIGTDFSPGCFICGGASGLYANVAGFVRSKEDGERVVGLFVHGAWLDYRSDETHWIQVKIGACTTHLRQLERLYAVTKAGTISADLLNEVAS